MKEFIQNNIHKLKVQDLEKYAQKNHISYTKDEAIIIYQFIQYHYQDILNENIKVFEEIRDKISPTLYQKLLTLYIDYKQNF